MIRIWQNLTRRQRVLLMVAVILLFSLLLTAPELKLSGLPLPGNIRQEESQFKKLRRELAALQKEEQSRQNRLFKLRSQAKPLWSKPAKVPTVEVQSELEKVARRAHVTLQNVGAPRTTKTTDNITSVELTLRLTGSMRDIGLFLSELDKNEPAFFWATCTLRPDNPREPRGVTLDGRIQALILSADAIKFFAETKESAP